MKLRAPTAVLAAFLLACHGNSAAGIEARRLQNEEGEPGCSFPGPITAAACTDNGWCLLCWRQGDNPNYPSVCASVRADGCR